MEEAKKAGTSKKKKVMITLIVIILLVVIAVLGFIIYKLLHKEPEDRGVSEGLVTDETMEQDNGEMFTTDMNMTWYFPSGKRTSLNARVGNSKDNAHPVYFEVYLNDEEQTLLYSSPVIPVGQRLKKLKLDKALPDGEHSALCTFHLLKDDDPKEEVSRVSFQVDLIFGEK